MKKLLRSMFASMLFASFFAAFAFSASSAQAADYALDPRTSSAKFHLQSGIAELSGELHDYDATLKVISSSPLRFAVSAIADLRSLKLDGTEGMQALSGALAKSVADPQMRLSGEVRKSVKTGACTFGGTVRRGKQVRRMQMPCKILQANSEAVVIVTKVTTPLSQINDDLPFQLPFAEGEGEASGRFRFVALNSESRR